MADITIVRSQQVPSGDPARVGKLDLMVVYQVGPGGPFRTVFLQDPQAPPEVVQQAIRVNEQHANAINGMHFTV